MLLLAGLRPLHAQTLLIESWRTEDQRIWEQRLLPSFHRAHPGITVKFSPTARALYDQTLLDRLENGKAGDIISCRPFDTSLALFRKGHLLKLDELKALAHFPPAHRIAWQTDDASTTFCLPVASVMHGIFYNKAIFRRLRLPVPTDEASWFAAMRRIREVPGLTPLALGTADRWESHQLLFTNIGPNHWRGERGRNDLLTGRSRFTEPGFIQTWQTMHRLAEFLPRGYAAMGYEDMLDLFGRNQAAMRPGGSWEIPQLLSYPRLDIGVFPPPVPQKGQPCHVTDHLDIGMGINARSEHKDAARKFLEWLGSAEFAQLYAQAAVGFYPLSLHPTDVVHPLAREMLSWRDRCQTTIRLNAQIINRLDADMEDLFWTVNALVLNHQLSPQEAGARLQRLMTPQAPLETAR